MWNNQHRYTRLTQTIARNLKFYPLTLYRAIKDGPLWFTADKFKVTNCVGEEKLFKDLSVWELLNLRPQMVLGLADSLRAHFGITSKYLEGALDPYSIQTIGKADLEHYFGITKQMKYLLSKTRHYSWPKGGGMSIYFTSFYSVSANNPSHCGPWIGEHARNQPRFGWSY